MPIILAIVWGLLLAWLAWWKPWQGPRRLAWPQLWARSRRPIDRWKGSQREARLADQLPQILEALSAALRAGQSLPQALESAADELPEPGGGQLRGVLQRLRLGEAPEAVLDSMADGFHGALQADWRLLSTGVAIQRSSGGDLAGLLDSLAETLRERQRLQGQIQALTAQGRLSAWVVGLLPPALLLALQCLDPSLTEPLYGTPKGWALLAAGLVLEGLGVLVLRRIVTLEA